MGGWGIVSWEVDELLMTQVDESQHTKMSQGATTLLELISNNDRSPQISMEIT
jgi:hypothetical protein